MKLVSLLIIFTLFSNLFAQKIYRLNLEEALKIASEQNLQLKEKRFKIKIAENKLEQVKRSYFLPILTLRNASGFVPGVDAIRIDSINYAYANKSEDSYSDWGPFTDFKVEALQPIFTFGKLSGLKNAAKANIKVQSFDFQSEKIDILYDVKKYYWSYLLASELVELSNDTQKKIKEAKKKVEDKLEEGLGEVTQADLFKIKLRETEVKEKVRQAETAKILSLEVLKLTLGINYSDSLFLEDEKLASVKFEKSDLNILIEKSFQSRADFQQLKFGIQAKKFLLEEARSEFFPQFFIGAEYKFNKTPGRDDIDNPFLVDNSNFNSYKAVIGFKQNLGFHVSSKKVEKAKFEYQELLAKEKYSKEGIKLEVKKAFLEAEDLRLTVRELSRMTKMTSGWYKTTASDYDLGLGELKELVEAFSAKVETEQKYLDTVYKFNLAIAKLEKVSGIELIKY
ncbi:MAG: TolC family protein [Calditrichaeota bacterium]|nr:MAG: TolC family protein [Calditrichota bacterium]